MAPAREACEIHGLLALQDYVTAARAGAAFDSLAGRVSWVVPYMACPRPRST